MVRPSVGHIFSENLAWNDAEVYRKLSVHHGGNNSKEFSETIKQMQTLNCVDNPGDSMNKYYKDCIHIFKTIDFDFTCIRPI